MEGNQPENDVALSLKNRLKKFGLKRIIKSADFCISSLIFLFLIIGYLIYNITMPLKISIQLLDTIMIICGSLFAVTLAGFAIISSFSDKKYLLIWKKGGSLENLVTLFQINLLLPLVILLGSFFVRFWCTKQICLILIISAFIYLILSLMHLTSFICHYTLLYGEFLEIEDSQL